LVNRIDRPLADLLRTMMGFIGQIRLRKLIETLEALRENPA